MSCAQLRPMRQLVRAKSFLFRERLRGARFNNAISALSLQFTKKPAFNTTRYACTHSVRPSVCLSVCLCRELLPLISSIKNEKQGCFDN